MRIALDDLRLVHRTVLYPGSRAYDLAESVSAMPLARLDAGDPEAILPRARGRRK